MHHALALPEIVSSILRTASSLTTYEDELAFLLPCLYVNRLFSLETQRLLWDTCGAGFTHRPQIRHLAALVDQDHGRAQHYANFVSHLHFDEEGDGFGNLISNSSDNDEDDGEDEEIDNPPQDEARWHSTLAAVQFPRLRSLVLDGSVDSNEMHTVAAVTHYFQRSLKELKMLEGEVTDELLEVLAVRSPGLEKLTIVVCDDTLTEAGLLAFLSDTRLLASLTIRPGLERLLSSQLLCALATHPSLQDVVLPAVQFNHLDRLSQLQSANFTLFPALQQLITSISNFNLDSLLRLLPQSQLTSLRISLTDGCPQVLTRVSRLSNLTTLMINSADNTLVTREDLLQLAENCPNLQTVEVPGYSCHASRSNLACASDEVDDTVVEEILVHWPNLKTFSFGLRPLSCFSHATLIALARCCKQLQVCELSANVNMPSLVKNLEEANLFLPQLTFLSLIFDQENPNEYPDDDLGLLADRFAFRFPALNYTSFLFGSNSDNLLNIQLHSRLRCALF